MDWRSVNEDSINRQEKASTLLKELAEIYAAMIDRLAIVLHLEEDSIKKTVEYYAAEEYQGLQDKLLEFVESIIPDADTQLSLHRPLRGAGFLDNLFENSLQLLTFRSQVYCAAVFAAASPTFDAELRCYIAA